MARRRSALVVAVLAIFERILTPAEVVELYEYD